MKITEYDKAKNANTISIIFGIGVRDSERRQTTQFIENLGFKLSSSESIDSTDGTKASVVNYTLKGG